jgi:hypothetical protein
MVNRLHSRDTRALGWWRTAKFRLPARAGSSSHTPDGRHNDALTKRRNDGTSHRSHDNPNGRPSRRPTINCCEALSSLYRSRGRRRDLLTVRTVDHSERSIRSIDLSNGLPSGSRRARALDWWYTARFRSATRVGPSPHTQAGRSGDDVTARRNEGASQRSSDNTNGLPNCRPTR